MPYRNSSKDCALLLIRPQIFKQGFFSDLDTIGIHQPNYFPWAGYFHKIARVKKFIFLDDVQYSKGSYINRVQYLSNGDVHWLTVPCKPKLGTKINEVPIVSNDWQQQHLQKIEGGYKKCPMFAEVWPNIQKWLSVEANRKLSDLNIYIIKEVCVYLDIKTKFYRSSEIFIDKELSASDRLVSLVKAVGGNEYFSGSGATKYQEEGLFFEQNVSITYSSFVESPRRQKSTCFKQGLSILDLILNIDPARAKRIILGKG